MKNLIQLIILTLAMTGAAFAQLNEPTPTKVLSLSGVQSSSGKFISSVQQVMANTFVLDGSTPEYTSTLFTISVDYTGEADYINGNAIVGGSWNLAIYAKGNYIGSVFGEVSSGQVTWPAPHDRRPGAGVRSTTAELKVTGGTGDFAGHSSRENIYYKSNTNLDNGDTQATIEHLEL